MLATNVAACSPTRCGRLTCKPPSRRSGSVRRSSRRSGSCSAPGLGGLADELEVAVEIPYEEIPGWPSSTAVGHAGRLVLGTIAGVPLAVMRGRAHVYEGLPAEKVVFGVRVLARLGIGALS